MRSRLARLVLVSFAVSPTLVACDEAELSDCARINQLVVGDSRYCVYPGGDRDGQRCPLSVRYPIDLPRGYVCASSPQTAGELPIEVCALFEGGCVPAADAGDAGSAATMDAFVVDAGPVDAMPRLDARPPDMGPTDAGPRLDAAPRLDAGPRDAGPTDLGPSDAGSCDGPLADELASGAQHACVIADGALFCWGSNLQGQLGIGTSVGDVPAPTRIGMDIDWSRVAAGEQHTCGVRASGTLWCWGDERGGRLGLPDGTYRAPTRVGVGEEWIAVAAGIDATCAITRSGDLHCFGENGFGQLGNGTTTRVTTSDAPSVGEPTTWRAVDIARAHTCARSTGDALHCWGRNGQGELGTGTSGPDAGLLVPSMEIGGRDWIQVALGGSYTCARESPDAVYCWGSGSDGRLGLGADDADRSVPTPIGSPAGLGSIDLAVGDAHACAIGSAGRLRCWGNNDFGELGNGTRDAANTPLPVDGSRVWEDVSAGNDHTCAIDDGALFCWGALNGAPAAGPAADPAIPTRVCLPSL
ncbi:MAG: hypothetical protein IT379_26455 [Deltaproteobacteria bacterium]|nr:hypothetical protein [Deltaproteobacteria bacterium]